MKRDDLSSGRAARIGTVGDEVIIITYTNMDNDDARKYKPKIVIVDKNNKASKIL